MKVVLNHQSSEAHEINAGIHQDALLEPTLFLLYINDLPKNIFRSLINVYSDDNMMYGCTSKYLDDQCLAADLYSDLTLTVQWGKGSLF